MVDLYPRIVQGEIRLHRREQFALSNVKPFIDKSHMNMDGDDEVIPLTRGEALLMIERLAEYVRTEEKTDAR